MENLKKQAVELLANQHFDCLAVGIIDFKNKKFESFEIADYDLVSEKPYLYFDLASITKTLTNAAVHLKQPELFDTNAKLLLNHKAGLPMGGRLSNYNWREFLWNYEIKESETLYSDYSSLRCMLEIEKKSGKSLRELCSFYFDPETKYWLDLAPKDISPITGWRNKELISGVVHDDNCFVISEFISHAGMFSTINGLCQTLLNLNKEASIIDRLIEMYKTQKAEDRFIGGFDRVQDLSNTSAGEGCSLKTFGHLGFTGTSYWIDIEKMKGAVILTNGTRSYWYERSGLISLRKDLNSKIWSY